MESPQEKVVEGKSCGESTGAVESPQEKVVESTSVVDVDCVPLLAAAAACCWTASQLGWPRPSWWEGREMGGGCCVMTMGSGDADAVV